MKSTEFHREQGTLLNYTSSVVKFRRDEWQRKREKKIKNISSARENTVKDQLKHIWREVRELEDEWASKPKNSKKSIGSHVKSSDSLGGWVRNIAASFSWEVSRMDFGETDFVVSEIKRFSKIILVSVTDWREKRNRLGIKLRPEIISIFDCSSLHHGLIEENCSFWNTYIY